MAEDTRMNWKSKFRVISLPPDEHVCGKVTDFPEIPVGSVVQCTRCGRFWKRRKDWTGPYDERFRWSVERRWERRRRLKGKGAR